MKKLIALSLATLAAPVLAQSAPAPAASTRAFSIQTTSIEALAADPRTKAVVDKELPQLLSHPAYDQFKSMTLAALAPMSQGSITDEKLAAIDALLAAIK